MTFARSSCTQRDTVRFLKQCSLFLPSPWWLLKGPLATRAAVNPLAGNEHLVQSEKNVLTNTVEQLLVFLLLVLTMTSHLEPSEMRIIPLYSLTFFIGRVFFMIGYSFGPRYRGAGMYINACLGLFFLGYSIYLIYLRGFMYGIPPFLSESLNFEQC